MKQTASILQIVAGAALLAAGVLGLVDACVPGRRRILRRR